MRDKTRDLLIEDGCIGVFGCQSFHGMDVLSAYLATGQWVSLVGGVDQRTSARGDEVALTVNRVMSEGMRMAVQINAESVRLDDAGEVFDINLVDGVMTNDHQPIIRRHRLESTRQPCGLGTAILRENVLVELAGSFEVVVGAGQRAGRVGRAAWIPVLLVRIAVILNARTCIQDDHSHVVAARQVDSLRVVSRRQVPNTVDLAVVNLCLDIITILMIAECVVPGGLQRGVLVWLHEIHVDLVV